MNIEIFTFQVLFDIFEDMISWISLQNYAVLNNDITFWEILYLILLENWLNSINHLSGLLSDLRALFSKGVAGRLHNVP